MNVGPLEIVIVLVLALLVFGPKQLPQMGRTLGKGVREFRRAADTARTELGLDDISAELGKVKSGFNDLKADIDVKGAIVGPPPTPAEPVADLQKEPADAEGEGQAAEEVGYTKTPEAPIADDVPQPEASEAPATEVAGPETPEAPETGDALQPGTSAVPGP